MATEITKGVEQVSVGKEEISLARAGQLVSKLASKDMCVLHIASVAVILAVSTLANADSCFCRSGSISIHMEQGYTVTELMCGCPINDSCR